MTRFLGEYECKVDAKGRLMIPSGLNKQLLPEARDRFVVNRGFEKHLVLYPFNEWEKISSEINRLNLYVKKNRQFVRYFYRGATELSPDSNNRILFPKSLMEYANLKKDVVLFAYSNRIEIWNKEEYEGLLDDEPADFSDLAEDVMGDLSKEDNDE
ncbi:MAG: division/cell wall cluster transcriptional repressor MraZ [Chitinophagaceae bacterium]|nr:MAG: division/cell wall cluster transcriptional repressor MraZ [Chitinophagaceae bacterium]